MKKINENAALVLYRTQIALMLLSLVIIVIGGVQLAFFAQSNLQQSIGIALIILSAVVIVFADDLSEPISSYLLRSEAKPDDISTGLSEQ